MATGEPKLAYRAALSRLVVALGLIVLQPISAAEQGHAYWAIGIYMVFAAVGQVMIWKQLGGWARVVIWGVFDIIFITYLVHLFGSLATILVALYILVGVMNAVVADTTVAVGLAYLASFCYLGLLLAEYRGWLDYAPGVPLAYTPPFDPGVAITAALMLPLMVLATTTIVGRLVVTVRKHEQELLQVNEQLELLSQRDPLTQLFNRRYLLARIDQELARVRRKHPLALLMVDLDQFKHLNDHHGHIRGDEALVKVSAVLEKATRETDVVGRFGGDEFVVVLPDTEHDEATVVAERLVQGVRKIGRQLDPGHPITASVGLALALTGDVPEDLIRRADEGTYRVKAHGGDAFISDSTGNIDGRSE